MIWPYGGSPPRAPAQLDRWLPVGAIALERHAVDLRADPSAALRALEELRLNDIAVVKALLALRGLPSSEGTVHQFFRTAPFVELDALPGRERVFGILGPFWSWGRGRTPPLVARDPGEFRRALDAGVMAAIANFRADPAPGGTRLWTETWVQAPRGLPRALFTGYWLAIGPFSAWIRRLVLRAAARRTA